MAPGTRLRHGCPRGSMRPWQEAAGWAARDPSQQLVVVLPQPLPLLMPETGSRYLKCCCHR